MAKTVRIGLLFNYTYSYYRNVLRGLRQFAETRPDWQFMPVFVENRKLRWRGKLAPQALLATVNNAVYARAVQHWPGPIVNVSAVLHELPYPRVAVDNAAIGCLAAEHLLETGLRKFAFVGHRSHLFSVEREAAFCSAIRDGGGEFVSSYHAPRDHPFEPYAQQWHLDRRIHDWLRGLPKPIGIFTPGDLFGAELTGICQEIELRVPDDVAVVGVDNDEVYCHLARPPLSSVQVNAGRVGYEAGRLLDQLLSGRKPPQHPILISPRSVHVRRSSEVLAIDDEDVVAAARFIREHSHELISVADILKEVPISRRSLERRFRKALGRGLAEEIGRVRLERCKHLLAETDFNMPAVARHSGFSSARHLAAVFSREVGMSPSEFRKRTRPRSGLS